MTINMNYLIKNEIEYGTVKWKYNREKTDRKEKKKIIIIYHHADKHTSRGLHNQPNKVLFRFQLLLASSHVEIQNNLSLVLVLHSPMASLMYLLVGLSILLHPSPLLAR